MFKVSFKKILRDLFQEKGKLFAVVLAISIGIFCFALLSTAQDLLKKNLSADYLATNPRDFAISVMNIDDQYLDDISSYDYIEDLEVRTKVPARIMVDDNYLALDLYVVEDFNDIVINTFGLDSGNLPIISNELLIERDGKKLIDMEIGDSLDVRIPDYSNRQVTVSGFAHDPSFAPSSNEGIIYGYISEDFLGEYGYELAYKDIYITLSGDVKTKADVEAISFALKDEMMSRDVIVRSVTNLEPNTHPNQTQMNALMFLLMMIGSLALILSGFIIITMISSIMEKQLSQIGILKTIGASTKQIIGIYMTTVLILTLISTIIALPLGIMAGYQYAGFVCAFLNFNLILTQLSIGTIILQIVFTLGVPLLMSLLPIIKSSRITVREAIYKDITSQVFHDTHCVGFRGRPIYVCHEY
jgi:putative ABC transport system permease protein